MSDQLTYRPVGFSDSTVRLTELTNEIEITAYLWGGGGGAGGNVSVPNGPIWRGGNGTGSGFSSVTFTAGPADNIVISVGGGGSAGTTVGGTGGRGFVLGSTSFTGATGGNGAGAAAGGGSGAATVLWKNGVILAVAAGGGGGGGASLTSNGINAPIAGNAGAGVFAGQNGQTKNFSYTGGGGGGAGGAGYPAGNGATLDSLASPGPGGGVGFSFGSLTGMPQGVLPPQASNPYRRGAGQGGSHQPDVNGFSTPNGTAGVAILAFSYVPGLSVKNDGVWTPVKKTWIKINGVWVEVKESYLRISGQWRVSLNGTAPNFVNVPGQFGYAPRAATNQDGPPPPPPPSVTGSFTGPTYINENAQDQVRLTALGPDSGPYSYNISAVPGVIFDTQTGNPPSGTLNQYQTAAVNLVTPHPATTLTATISRAGYISYQANLQVPARQIPSGFVEFVRAGTQGTWIVPPGVLALRITLVGGGGGGAAGSESNPYWSGGGGGGSGGINQFVLSVIPGSTFSYYVGIGGAGTGPVGAGGRPGNSGTATTLFYSQTLTDYRANGGTGGGTSGGNISNGHWNGAGLGGSPGGTNGIAGQSRAGASAGRNLMSGGPGGSAAPFGFGGLAAPGVPEGGPATDANQNGQSATGYGAGGGGGAGGKNDAPQGQGGAGTGGYIRIEWG